MFPTKTILDIMKKDEVTPTTVYCKKYWSDKISLDIVYNLKKVILLLFKLETRTFFCNENCIVLTPWDNRINFNKEIFALLIVLINILIEFLRDIKTSPDYNKEILISA